MKNIETYPVLPLRNIVVFPSMVVPLFVGRERSINALDEVMRLEKEILLVTQKREDIEDPKTEDLYEVGTMGTVMQLLRLPDGTVKVLIEGGKRVRIMKYQDDGQFITAQVMPVVEFVANPEELPALAKTAASNFSEYAKLDKKIAPELLNSVEKITEPSKLADTIAQNLTIKLSERQELLELFAIDQRLEKILNHMEGEISIVQVEKKIRSRVKKSMEKTQREYYLNEQMKAIQRELGGEGEGKSEIDEIKERAAQLELTQEARDKFNAEVKKLQQMSPVAAEATVIRNYLDWIVSLPWLNPSKTKKDLDFAEKILNADHHGLEKVKERILEHLAVLLRVKKLKGPILCLVGPPGVGKTSLGRSIARATNRKFVRMSLGGVRDEAEIRGHRRTYIGSLPGRIIQGMKKAGNSNPLFLLDEIDKMGGDWRGDPSAALLEVLDPEQNSTFHDHYLELDYDLSDVMFICTANSMNIPAPLADRMEIIRLSGYTEEEKIAIAKGYLVPKIIKDHGLKTSEFSVNDDAIRDIIRYYTREAGVRGLERSLQKLARKSVRKILQSKEKAIAITADNLADFAGVKQFRYGKAEEEDQVGVVTGLAWTEVGGDILMIESILKRGNGKVTKTGNLKSVMQESIEAASNYVNSRAASLGIDKKTLTKNDVHVHVPEGATPKDGPSAGVAMVTSMVSSLTGIAVNREVAMTGEITLRGRVLPIGGLKEKLLAAMRAGIKIVIIPKDNEKDLVELPKIISDNLIIKPVTWAHEVLEIALVQKIKPVIWEDDPIIPEKAEPANMENTDNIHH